MALLEPYGFAALTKAMQNYKLIMRDKNIDIILNNKCPNCNIELETTHISDVPSGDVLVSAHIEYCSQCLYLSNSDIKLSK